jgi:hypothetical protein
LLNGSDYPAWQFCRHIRYSRIRPLTLRPAFSVRFAFFSFVLL